VAKCAYLSDFCLFLSSMYCSPGMVSSKRWRRLASLSTSTTSGLRAVMVMVGGMVPPPAAWCPGRSLYRSALEVSMQERM